MVERWDEEGEKKVLRKKRKKSFRLQTNAHVVYHEQFLRIWFDEHLVLPCEPLLFNGCNNIRKPHVLVTDIQNH